LKTTTKDIIGVYIKQDPNAIKSFNKGITKGVIALSNTVSAPGMYVADFPNRSADENTRLGAYYLTQFGLMYGSADFLASMDVPPLKGLPQGISNEKFKLISTQIFAEVGYISDDVVIQGSRASGVAKLSSDVDIAIKVSPEKFDQLILEKFGKPNPGSARYRTMEYSIKNGIIQTGEARLRGLRDELEKILNLDVDLSIVKKGGEFDKGAQIPLIPPTKK
jgi:predicted nucleotidyltransferase